MHLKEYAFLPFFLCPGSGHLLERNIKFATHLLELELLWCPLLCLSLEELELCGFWGLLLALPPEPGAGKVAFLTLSKLTVEMMNTSSLESLLDTFPGC